MKTTRLLKFAAMAVLLGSPVWMIVPAGATLTLSDTPLFLTGTVEPNIVFTLDDSLSMGRGFVPERVNNTTAALDGPRFKSAYYNGMYYDPASIYTIPTRSDGTSYSTSFTTAYFNGFDTSKGSVNLSSGYKVIAQSHPSHALSACTGTITTTDDWNNCLLAKNPATGTTIGVQAYYYRFYSEIPVTQPGACTGTAAQQKEDNDCYIRVNVSSTSGPGGFDLNKDDVIDATDKDERQNFANWYSFYRTRAMTAMSGAMNAVTGLDNGAVRLGWQTLNQCTTFSASSCQGYTTTNSQNRIRTLSTAYKTNFYNWLQRFELTGSTPMRGAMVRAGDYFKLNGVNSPYAQDPYVTLGTEYSCRKNYHVMFTDGYWNGNNSTNYGGDLDSSGTTNLPATDLSWFFTPTPATYTAKAPYKDVNTTSGLSSTYSNSNSLADIAFKYWVTDLRAGATSLLNNVLPKYVDKTGTETEQYWNPKNDPATWQHMVNYAIGLGLSEALVSTCNYLNSSTPIKDPNNPTPGCPVWGGSTYAGDYSALKAGTKNWPKINESATLGQEPDGHVYDLWHAAINSRGQFFSADNPVAVSEAFKRILGDISDKASSSAALAANSTNYNSGTAVYQAQFDPSSWSGRFYNFPVSASGKVVDLNGDGKLNGSDASWDAASLIPAAASRKIFTTNGGTVQAFSSCTSSLATALNKDSLGVVDGKCSDRLAWLRGDTSKETNFPGGTPNPSGIFRYRPVTVLGDIVNSDPIFSLNEDFGYTALPAGTPGQSSYASYLTGKNSRTPMVYVGANDGMLHGFRSDIGHADSGKELLAYVPAGVYGSLSALTDPAYLHKYLVDGPPNVGDAYIGTTPSWKTVLVGGLGAGGKSIYALDVSAPDTFDASKVLWEYADIDLGLTYGLPQIARLHDGSWAAIFGNGYNSSADKAYLYIVNLETGALIKKIPTDSATANGLSTPVLYDSDNDRITDAVYAGDLQGRMWKFDLSSASTASWTASLLFAATNASSQPQPITTQPLLGPSPTSSTGVMVYFGTGSYITTTDASNMQVQSYYAIWDNGALVTKIQLQQQTIDTETVVNGYSWRTTSDHTVNYAGAQRGWYMDLLPPSPGTPKGERVIYKSQLFEGRVIFVTLIPSADKCVPGGTGWLMELGTVHGQRPTEPILDVNDDGVIDGSDKVGGENPTGKNFSKGFPTPPALITKKEPGKCVLHKIINTSTGEILTINNKCEPPNYPIPTRVFWQQIL